MHIWTLDLGDETTLGSQPLSQQLLHRCQLLLSSEEQAKAERFMFDPDRYRYILAHGLCRLMLSRFGQHAPHEWVFDKETKGRPFLNASRHSESLDFNLSHTRGMVGCALTNNGRLGFDLESKSRQANLQALAERQFAPIEQKQFRAAPRNEQGPCFFQFWTLKEAYIKYTGKGLSEDLTSFGFDITTSQPGCYLNGKRLENLRFGLFDVGEGYQGAWAYGSGNVVNEQIEPEFTHFSLQSFNELISL